ncbi:hypothetical protein [Burkholderia pseudomultivorans]|nr:hypothetical protein [Burkholderia pseudomultivorans]
MKNFTIDGRLSRRKVTQEAAVYTRDNFMTCTRCHVVSAMYTAPSSR